MVSESDKTSKQKAKQNNAVVHKGKKKSQRLWPSPQKHSLPKNEIMFAKL